MADGIISAALNGFRDGKRQVASLPTLSGATSTDAREDSFC